MNKFRFVFASQAGFAMGMVLLVIIMIAAISAALSLTTGNQMAYVDRDRIKSSVVALKSHGAHIRETIKNMERIYRTGDIDYGSTCTGERCVAAKVRLQKIPSNIFSGNPTGAYGYNYWSMADAAVFNTFTTRVFVLKPSVTSDVCTMIESMNRVSSVNDNDILVATSFAVDNVNNGDTFTAQFNWDPSSQDGCFKYQANRYYYVIIGTGN
ncbi:MAG: hypothetical protein EYC62_07450 [Alphaproteobacteria bacterium]|nr:MAG: hypothetical protein EYC62_07450 [Alphaproteobacteria bacterium]